MTSLVVADLPPPPEGTRYVRRQAGGHHEKNGDAIIPNLEHRDGNFLKLYRTPQRGATELAFYQRVFDPNSTDPILISLRPLIPNFNGIYTMRFQEEEVRFLKFEDITRKFLQPCVLDVKLKADVHDPYSSHAHPKYSFAEKHGFLIDGIQVYHRTSGQYIAFGKSFGRKLDEEGVQRGLFSFLNADSGVDEWLVRAFMDRLERVHRWASEQKHFSFYRSSLLLVYDAQGCMCTNLDQGLSRTDVRMVDFAKVYQTGENDPKYENAVANLVEYLSRLLSESNSSNVLEQKD